MFFYHLRQAVRRIRRICELLLELHFDGAAFELDPDRAAFELDLKEAALELGLKTLRREHLFLEISCAGEGLGFKQK